MDDRIIITTQLGREPRGSIEVVARCEYGLPAVLLTSPKLDSGEPFPTLYYLTCPMAVRAIGRLEAAGEMTRYEERLATEPALRESYARAHGRYVAARDAIEEIDEPMSAGGMPDRVKCLHALYAHEIADENPIGALVREQIEPLRCPSPCVVDGARAPGHPGFGKKKRH